VNPYTGRGAAELIVLAWVWAFRAVWRLWRGVRRVVG
jgi:hypothetical protein